MNNLETQEILKREFPSRGPAGNHLFRTPVSKQQEYHRYPANYLIGTLNSGRNCGNCEKIPEYFFNTGIREDFMSEMPADEAKIASENLTTPDPTGSQETMLWSNGTPGSLYKT
jgi:hypothetical protein